MIEVSDKCIHCGLCIKDCICNVIAFDAAKVPYAKHPDSCIKCQHCMAICPVGALSVNGKKPENSPLTKLHNPEDLLNLIKDRRSFRLYKQENVEPEKMQKLKNMLNWVPSGVNNHGLFFAFIDDIDVMNDIRVKTRQRIKELFERNDTSVKPLERYKKGILNDQIDMIFRGAPHMVFVAAPVDAPCVDIDPVIALSYFELYAQSLGVATCWCGIGYWVFTAVKELQERLQIPAGYKLSYTMLFGPAAVQYSRSVQPEPLKMISVK